MTKFIAWAQVMPAKPRREFLIADCSNGCGKSKWIVNGRSSGLTRTSTTYACDLCLASVLDKQDWSK
jgi:hypothetical protein